MNARLLVSKENPQHCGRKEIIPESSLHAHPNSAKFGGRAPQLNVPKGKHSIPCGQP